MYDPGLHKDTSREWDFSGTPGSTEQLQEGLQHKRRKERREGGRKRQGRGRGLILEAVSHLDTVLSSDLSLPTEKPSFLLLWPWEALFSTLRKAGFSPFNLPRLVPQNN